MLFFTNREHKYHDDVPCANCLLIFLSFRRGKRVTLFLQAYFWRFGVPKERLLSH